MVLLLQRQRGTHTWMQLCVKAGHMAMRLHLSQRCPLSSVGPLQGPLRPNMLFDGPNVTSRLLKVTSLQKSQYTKLKSLFITQYIHVKPATHLQFGELVIWRTEADGMQPRHSRSYAEVAQAWSCVAGWLIQDLWPTVYRFNSPCRR